MGTLNDLGTWPAFDGPVVPRGYRWWYLDATAADGQHHLIMIAFVGSVFSPFYARACAAGAALAHHYCAFNVALYGPESRHVWVFTEYEPEAVEREANLFRLGRNALTWDGDALSVGVDDRSAPLRQAVCGDIVATPTTRTQEIVHFGSGQRHSWQPLAPAADVAVRFRNPALQWDGHGYIDTNGGDEPLHEGFDDWHWCRWHDGAVSRIQYHATHRDGGQTALDLTIQRDGAVTRSPLPTAERLPSSGWRVAREWYPTSPGARVVAIDDTPFYARSLVWPQRAAQPALPVMHESLALGRFRAPWVRQLLPFRMRFPLGRLIA